MKDKLLNSPCIKRRYERIAEVQGIFELMEELKWIML